MTTPRFMAGLLVGIGVGMLVGCCLWARAKSQHDGSPEEDDYDDVDRASIESFPASDPQGY
jgi:hypothetical protein